MRHALLAGAVIAVSVISPSANAAIWVVGQGPAADCYVAAATDGTTATQSSCAILRLITTS